MRDLQGLSWGFNGFPRVSKTTQLDVEGSNGFRKVLQLLMCSTKDGL